MEQKIKFLLLGLVGIIIISFVFLAQVMTAKQQVMRQRDDLQKEKTILENKVGKLEESLRANESKFISLNSELKRVNKEKEDLQVKYDSVKKTSDELVDKINQLKSKPSSTSTATPQTNDAYWGSILQEKADLEMQLASVRNELRSILITNEQLQREKSTLELQLKSLLRESEDSKRQMDYNKKIMDRISEDLVTERNDKMKIQESLKTLKNENATLLRQVENLNSRKIDLEQKLRQIQEDRASLERKFHDMENLLNNNISQVTELKDKLESKVTSPQGLPQPQAVRKESVELSPIVVRPQGTGVAKNDSASSVGRVLATNKEGNFVIIDLGEDAGIKMGDAFSVYRDGNKIANIEVIRTSKSVSACDIKRQDTPIKIGDSIK